MTESELRENIEEGLKAHDEQGGGPPHDFLFEVLRRVIPLTPEPTTQTPGERAANVRVKLEDGRICIWSVGVWLPIDSNATDLTLYAAKIAITSIVDDAVKEYRKKMRSVIDAAVEAERRRIEGVVSRESSDLVVNAFIYDGIRNPA